MKREDKIFGVAWAIAGVAVFVLLMNSYAQTPDEYIASPMAIKEIPLNANKVDDVKACIIPYKGIDYGRDVNFLPTVVNNEEFFKIKSLDEINFSINYKRSGAAIDQDTIVVSIRGIKHSELPLVYDYSEELSLWPAELSRASWYNSDGIRFTANENTPWAVNVKISKQAHFAVIASLVLSIIIGYLAAIIAVSTNRLRERLLKK